MRMFGISKARGRRSVPRAHAPLNALLRTQKSDHAVELIDLSRTGARVSGACFLAQGQQVTFQVETLRVAGEIIWVMKNDCAVEFDTPIAADEVNRVRASANLLDSLGPDAPAN